MATSTRLNTGRLRWRPLWVATGAGVALLLAGGLLPTRAPAAPTGAVSSALPPGYEIAQADFQVTLNPNTSTTGEVVCPGSKFAIGGGASIITEPTPASAKFSQVGNGNRPQSSGTWAATYFNIGTVSGSIGFRVWGFCADALADRVLASATSSVRPGKGFNVTSQGPLLRCPSGSIQAGGGVFYQNTVGVPLTLTKNSSQGVIWEAIYYNTLSSSAISATVDSALNCLRSSFSTETVNGDQNLLVPPGQYGVLPTLKCNGRPLAGGITLFGATPSDLLPTLATVEDGPVVVPPIGQTEWRFRVLNHGTQPLSAQYKTNLLCIS